MNELRRSVGQLVIGGFAGPELSPSFARALQRGERGGAILFKRNLPSVGAAHALCGAILAASKLGEVPPIIGVDQEGGRVARLPAPALQLPPMMRLASVGNPELIADVARGVARELHALGFNVNFAPVLDVNTEPTNPVIGDRAFADRPGDVATYACAYLRGLQQEGVAACGKHFPGHGDTHLDSHHALPVVHHPRERLQSVEWLPFRAAIDAGVAALMSAHVVYSALDASAPATLSRVIASDLLRDSFGYRGVLFSDDLEMKAVAGRGSIEDAAVAAVLAGCDALLVCSDESAQDRTFECVVREAERSPSFRKRCRVAAQRITDLCTGYPPKPAPLAQLADRVGGAASVALAEQLARALSG